MNKQEIIDYLYSFNTHADITIEEMADDLAIPSAEPYKGMTNGEVIKAMFSYGKYGTNGDYVHVYGVGGNGCLAFTKDWWNSPYGPQESEDKE